MSEAIPGYLDLRQVGYAFVNHGSLLGDRRGNAALCWYGIMAPDGTQISSAKGISAALDVARKHYQSSISAGAATP